MAVTASCRSPKMMAKRCQNKVVEGGGDGDDQVVTGKSKEVWKEKGKEINQLIPAVRALLRNRNVVNKDMTARFTESFCSSFSPKRMNEQKMRKRNRKHSKRKRKESVNETFNAHDNTRVRTGIIGR